MIEFLTRLKGLLNEYDIDIITMNGVYFEGFEQLHIEDDTINGKVLLREIKKLYKEGIQNESK